MSSSQSLKEIQPMNHLYQALLGDYHSLDEALTEAGKKIVAKNSQNIVVQQATIRKNGMSVTKLYNIQIEDQQMM